MTGSRCLGVEGHTPKSLMHNGTYTREEGRAPKNTGQVKTIKETGH